MNRRRGEIRGVELYQFILEVTRLAATVYTRKEQP